MVILLIMIIQDEIAAEQDEMAGQIPDLTAESSPQLGEEEEEEETEEEKEEFLVGLLQALQRHPEVLSTLLQGMSVL